MIHVGLFLLASPDNGRPSDLLGTKYCGEVDVWANYYNQQCGKEQPFICMKTGIIIIVKFLDPAG